MISFSEFYNYVWNESSKTWKIMAYLTYPVYLLVLFVYWHEHGKYWRVLK